MLALVSLFILILTLILQNGLSRECAFRLFLGMFPLLRLHKNRRKKNMFEPLQMKCGKNQKNQNNQYFGTLVGEMWKVPTKQKTNVKKNVISGLLVFPHFTSKNPKILVSWVFWFFLYFCVFWYLWFFDSFGIFHISHANVAGGFGFLHFPHFTYKNPKISLLC